MIEEGIKKSIEKEKELLTPLDSYKAKVKCKEAGKLAWNVLIIFSKITMFLFILITCILVWKNLSIQLLSNEINIIKQISAMFLIITIIGVLISIDYIISLILKFREKKR